MPKVSIVIPVYGVESYIERCVKSLFSQTLDDLEYIFVDDCTPDRSIEIVKEVLGSFPKRKNQVKIHRMPQNSGLPTARRFGISLSTGEYIAHCDSDDWVDVGMYEIMYNYAQAHDLDIVYSDYYKSDGITRLLIKQNEIKGLMSGPVWNKLVRASLYNNEIIYPKENKAEDGVLMMQLSYFAQSRGYVKTALYYYFNNPKSICRVPSLEACLNRYRQERENVNIRFQFLKTNQIEDKFKDDICLWKYESRKNLLPIIGEKQYLNLWNATYPEINSQVFFCKKMSLKSKFFFLIVSLGAYPLLNNISRHFKRSK